MQNIAKARGAARRAMAITAGGALLVLAGCSGESSQDAEDPPAAAQTEDGGADGSAATSDVAGPAPDAGEESAPAPATPDEEAVTTAPQPPSGGGDDSAGATGDTPEGFAGPAPYAEGEDPCAEVAAEHLTEAVESPLGELTDEGPQEVAKQLEESGGDAVMCAYPSEGDADDPAVSINWLRLGVDFPDEMPQDVQAEQERALHVNFATGQDGVEEVAVSGVPEAYASVDNDWGHTFVNVYVPFDDALLVASLFGTEGTLDESDIPRAVQAAEVAMARP